MKFTGILENSWGEYKSNFKTFSWIFIIFFVIPTIILFYLGYNVIFSSGIFEILIFTPPGAEQNSQLLNAIQSNAGIFWILGIAAVVALLVFIFAGACYLYSVLHKKDKISLSEAILGGKKYFWKYLGFSIVYVFLFFVLFLLFAVVSWFILFSFNGPEISQSTLQIYSNILFFVSIIPILILFVYLAFASYFLIGEDKRIFESFKASYHLVKGRFWKILSYFLLWILIGYAVFLLLQQIAYLPSSMVSSTYLTETVQQLSTADPNNLQALLEIFKSNFEQFKQAFFWNTVINALFQLIYSFVFVPLGILFGKNLYLALKKEKKR